MGVSSVHSDSHSYWSWEVRSKYRFLSHTPQDSELVSLGWGRSSCFLKTKNEITYSKTTGPSYTLHLTPLHMFSVWCTLEFFIPNFKFYEAPHACQGGLGPVNIVGKSMTSGARLPEFQSQLHHLAAVWP